MRSCWTRMILCRKTRKGTQKSTNVVSSQTEWEQEARLPSLRIMTERRITTRKSASVSLSKRLPSVQEPGSINSLNSQNSSLHRLKSAAFPDWNNPEVSSQNSRGIVWPESRMDNPFVLARDARWPKLRPVTPKTNARSLGPTRPGVLRGDC